jgi:hypothetical protein
MQEADNNQQKLNDEEKERNKRIGDVFVYLCGKNESSAMRRKEVPDGHMYSAEFESKDEIAG